MAVTVSRRLKRVRTVLAFAYFSTCKKTHQWTRNNTITSSKYFRLLFQLFCFSFVSVFFSCAAALARYHKHVALWVIAVLASRQFLFVEITAYTWQWSSEFSRTCRQMTITVPGCRAGGSEAARAVSLTVECPRSALYSTDPTPPQSRNTGYLWDLKFITVSTENVDIMYKDNWN